MRSIDEAIDVVNAIIGLQCKDCGYITRLQSKCGYCDSWNVQPADVTDLYFALKGKPKWYEQMLDLIVETLADEQQDNLWLSKKQAQLKRELESTRAAHIRTLVNQEGDV